MKIKQLQHKLRIETIRRGVMARVKRIIRREYVLYADSREILDNVKKLLRPLPQGLELIKLTYENKNLYKCTIGDVDKMLQVDGVVWIVVNNDNEVVGYIFGTYRGKKSLFFNVKNCDFEYIEIRVDEKYRRKGIALQLLYHMVENLNVSDVKSIKLGTVIHPNNNPSLKLHELSGFKKSHKILFIHFRWKKGGHYTFINIPRYNI